MGNAGNKAREVKGKPKTESKLRRIPDEAFALVNLKTLDLSFNRIEGISEYLNALVQLKTLNLRDNRLRTLVSIDALTKLTTLNVENNELEDFDQLPSSLTQLNARGNGLLTFPHSIVENCALLTELDLSNNSIRVIPAKIDQLLQIEKLVLDNNRVTCIPAEIASCQRLKILSLKHNRIEARYNEQPSIPPIVLDSSPIQVLNLHKNPITKEEFIQMQGADAFLERRKQLKDKGIHGGLETDASVCGLD